MKAALFVLLLVLLAGCTHPPQLMAIFAIHSTVVVQVKEK